MLMSEKTSQAYWKPISSARGSLELVSQMMWWSGLVLEDVRIEGYQRTEDVAGKVDNR